jgi:hypothetical protein
MKLDLKFFLLFISILVTVFLLYRNCKSDTITTVQTTTTVRIDTLKLHDTVYYPKPYKVIELQIDTLHVDTTQIIRDYFSEKYYQLSFNDSLLKATADIKVGENTLKLAAFNYEVYRPTIQITTMIMEKKMSRLFLSIGGGANYCILGKKAGVEFLATIGVKRQCISIGYDFINQTPRLGWQYRIK